jgi:catechol 2,3-dioxygenase-like lactoylglutathione lyase family enzyme
MIGEINSMINGAHVIIYSKDADADRAFFKDVLGFHHVDAGHGWLIFALPPAEVAVIRLRPMISTSFI